MQKPIHPTQQRGRFIRFLATFDNDTVWWIVWYLLVLLAFAAFSMSAGMMLVACQMELAKAAMNEPAKMVDVSPR